MSYLLGEQKVMSLLLNLDYIVLGELITCVLSFILFCNILISFSFYDTRQRYFGFAVLSCFFSAFFDTTSSICTTFYAELPLWLGMLSSTLFYIFLIATPFFICCYGIEIAYAYKPQKRKIHLILCYAVFLIYLVIVGVNIFNGVIFNYDKVAGYVRGKYNLIAYLITAIFAVILLSSVIMNRKAMAKRMFIVFLAYPVISCGCVFIQFTHKELLLSGISSFAALLFAYVSIQSDLLEYDTATGLMTENKLRKQVSLKKGNNSLYVLDIENMKLLNTNMDAVKFNMMMLDIGKEFSRVFERNVFHLSTSRFAAIAKKIDEAVEKGTIVEDYIKNLINRHDLQLPTNIEFHSAVISFKDYDFTYSTLMDVINSMLNQASNSGIKTIQVCDENVIANTSKRQNIYDILQTELTPESEQFQMWYQPVYSLKERKFTYVEALARLNGTKIGDLSAKEFLPVAEVKGFMEKLGKIAFDKVCRFIAENRTLVPAVSVNASVFQMANSNIIENVLGTISKYSLQPSNIIIEVTEDIFDDDYYFIIVEHMKKLAEAGISFHLDNFGIGKSSAQRLVTLPFTTIKMDKSLINKAVESKNEDTLFSGLTKTFKAAHFNVVAECIENRSQLVVANKAGVDFVQGFLSCKPLPPADCIDFLQKKKAD